MKRIILTYGLIAATITATAVTITCSFHDKMDTSFAMLFGYATMVLSFCFTYFGMASFKKNNSGVISFKQCMKIGMGIVLISSAAYALVWVILYNTVFPDFMAQYSAHEVANLKKAGASEAEITKTLEQMKEYKKIYDNPFTNFLFTFFVEPLPVGIVVTLISAGIIRLKRARS